LAFIPVSKAHTDEKPQKFCGSGFPEIFRMVVLDTFSDESDYIKNELQSISLTKVFKEDMKKCARLYDFPTDF